MTSNPLRVTIGLPVYNGEAVVASAIESILSQTYTDFRLVISDNASTDATERICREFAERDDRIWYIRQPMNIGADANFEFVLQQAQSEYFMWAAADDTRSPDFIEKNLRFLQTHPDYVGSTCPVRFAGHDYDPIRMGDQPRAEETVGLRILGFLNRWHANGRFYSLFRRQELVEARRNVPAYLGSDWTIVIRLLAIGKLHCLSDGSVDLGRGGVSNSKNIFSTYRRVALHWPLPFLDLQKATWAVVRNEPFHLRVRIALRLLKLNLHAAVVQAIHEVKRRLR